MKKILLSFALLSAAFCNAQVGTIITVCGTGTAGYTGDGGLATHAEINLPHGLTTDTPGNYYIADNNNSCLRKVTASGYISTFAGTGVTGYSGDGGQATAAQLNQPFTMRSDRLGNIFFPDTHNQRIRKITAAGIITTIGGTGATGFYGDGGPATNAKTDDPAGLDVDTAGNVIFGDQLNQCIRMINGHTGIITTIAGSGGVVGYRGDGGPASASLMSYPNYVYLDSMQNLFVTDNGNHCIRRIDRVTGIITTVAGTGLSGYNGDGIAATDAQLFYPGGITMDVEGNLYIADYNNSRVRVVTVDGMIHTLAGTGTPGFSGDGGISTAAEVNHAVDLSFNNYRGLLIADFDNNRIREIPKITLEQKLMTVKNEVVTYPNPTFSEMNITNISENNEYQIVNLTGKVLQNGTLKPGLNTLNLLDLTTGVYILQLTNEKGERKVISIVKE